MDILNLEFPNLDRDRHIITPVYQYLRKVHNVKVVSKNINNRFFFLCKYRPKLLLLSNAHGQNETIEIMKIAQASGIKVVTLVTEGNFHEENLHGYLWGWNHEKKLNQDAFILWNERSRAMALKHHPELDGKLYVSGATGFDRYSILNFKTKESFLVKYNLKKYERIIGIAGFGIFDHLESFDYMKKMHPAYSEEQYHMHVKDREGLRHIYYQLITSNPDTLFILRYHPQIRDMSRAEFTTVTNLPNVIISNNYIKSAYDLNSISDVISICDLWMGYESTTVIEAWLLKKPAILINPSGPDFVRENHNKGCPKFKNIEEVQSIINEFYSTGKIGACEELKNERDQIIYDIIGFSDGQNHRRASEIILSVLENQNRSSLYRIIKNMPLSMLFRNTLRYYLYRSWIYKMIKPNVWASKHWYPIDKHEVVKYENLYNSSI